jgi:ferredoxin/flavodoxin
MQKYELHELSAKGKGADKMKSFLVAYFSGTGGTEKIALAFERELKSRGIEARTISLDYGEVKGNREGIGEMINLCDCLVLAFPVHAFDAPKPVYDWINTIGHSGKKAVVVSVSGGGEGWPNIGVRENVCGRLRDRGFDVIYEKMMIMPSNWLVRTGEYAAMWLLKVMPEKVGMIIDDVLSGKKRLSAKKKSGFQRLLSGLEKDGARSFGKQIKIGSSCNSCGWCSRKCPVENIGMDGGKPVFKDDCIMCFRCIYGCPQHAMSSGNFMVLKSGYDLDGLERKMLDTVLPPVDRCVRGLLWLNLKKYILNKEEI